MALDIIYRCHPYQPLNCGEFNGSKCSAHWRVEKWVEILIGGRMLRRESNINIDLKVRGCGDVDWICLGRDNL
jgi:hypothetical protein